MLNTDQNPGNCGGLSEDTTKKLVQNHVAMLTRAALDLLEKYLQDAAEIIEALNFPGSAELADQQRGIAPALRQRFEQQQEEDLA